MEGEDRLREIGREFPFLGSVDGGRKCVVEMQPFVRGGGLTEVVVVLEGFCGVGGKAV